MENLNARMLVDLLRDRISPDRNLGQHFILDEKVIFEAVSMCNDIDKEVTKDSHVLEIGPGPGSLTLELLKTGARVTALEIDQQAVIHLGRVFTGLEERLSVSHVDALLAEWPEDITHVISNIPYGISSPILDRIQTHHQKNPFEAVVLLVQEEFSERMSMNGGPRSIGPLGLSLWMDFDIHTGSKVHPGAFTPPPRVNSRLIMLEPRSGGPRVTDRRLFKMITKHCFAYRRRKMRTLLSKPPKRISRIKGWHKSSWEEAIVQVSSNPIEGMRDGWLELRPDDLLIEEWPSLCDYFSSLNQEN